MNESNINKFYAVVKNVNELDGKRILEWQGKLRITLGVQRFKETVRRT